MKVIETRLPGVVVIEPKVFGDSRGFFYESYNADAYREAGIDRVFVQSNVSRSSHGVLRGLHYQWPRPQGKLVSVLEGEVYDVAVDIRRGSPNFGQWVAAVLSADNHRHFWIPEGFAHGFCVLSESAIFSYQCSDIYQPQNEMSLQWNDGDLAIDWPISQPSLADKDRKARPLAEIDPERLPIYAP